MTFNLLVGGKTLQIMVAKALDMCPDFPTRVRSWPREFSFGDLFSGTGSAVTVSCTLVDAIRSKLPKECEDLEAM